MVGRVSKSLGIRGRISATRVSPENESMVARVWKATLASTRVAEYRRHFDDRVIPALIRTSGYLGAQVLITPDVDPAELVVVTWWSSLDAIRAFAGPDVRRAVVDPEARAMLMRCEETVTLYDVIDDRRSDG
jgi:heme-degrading monooxygenase HmoA